MTALQQLKRGKHRHGGAVSKRHPPHRRSRKDYPQGIVGVYDNGGLTADRYTVVYTPYYWKPPECSSSYRRIYWDLRAMSEEPFHPQGVGLYCQAEGTRPGTGIRRRRWGNAYGKTIAFEDLPADCQKLALQDAKDIIDSWKEESGNESR